jgi:hypothetical protein
MQISYDGRGTALTQEGNNMKLEDVELASKKRKNSRQTNGST